MYNWIEKVIKTKSFIYNRWQRKTLHRQRSLQIKNPPPQLHPVHPLILKLGLLTIISRVGGEKNTVISGTPIGPLDGWTVILCWDRVESTVVVSGSLLSPVNGDGSLFLYTLSGCSMRTGRSIRPTVVVSGPPLGFEGGGGSSFLRWGYSYFRFTPRIWRWGRPSLFQGDTLVTVYSGRFCLLNFF